MMKKIFFLLTILFFVFNMKGETDHRIPLFLSVVIPGGGQIYNGKYLKAGVYIAAESIFIYGAYIQNTRLQDTRDDISDLELRLSADPTAAQQISGLEFLEDRYKKERNNFIWMSVTTILLSAGDAYVDSYFSEFKRDLLVEGDRLSLTPIANGVNLIYSWK